MTFECLLLNDPQPESGARNMAIDEALLDRSVRTGEMFLRFYQWNEPTLSLGYFQKDPANVPDSLAKLPRVRRLSGGGAILHDQELTYSLILPRTHPAVKSPGSAYALVHSVIVALLRGKGVNCKMRGGSGDPVGGAEFLCFSRGDPNDIVVDSHKIVGSAQRRRRGTVLQHGSLVTASSKLTPQFFGLSQFGCELNPVTLAHELSKPMLTSLAVASSRDFDLTDLGVAVVGNGY